MNTNQTLPAALIPELESFCGSWIVVSRETGKPVLETFERSTAERINQSKYEVLTAYQWRVRFNAMVREETAQKERLSSAAAILGKAGGESRSERKVSASRSNGKLGGRPKKPIVILD